MFIQQNRGQDRFQVKASGPAPAGGGRRQVLRKCSEEKFSA
jgi:hypothetical protein